MTWTRLTHLVDQFFEARWISEINPTLILTICLEFVWFAILSAGLVFHQFPFYFYLPLGLVQTLIAFLMFTPIHDSTHFVASRKKILNEIILFTSGIVFLSNPVMFRRIHFKHHSRTNQGSSDPDHFTSHSKLWMRILKSFLLIFYYHLYALKHFNTWKMRAHVLGSILAPILIIYFAIVSPFTWPILICWALPAFIGIGLLGFVNTAFPHHPGKEVGRYQNTRAALVPWIVQLLMLNQNLHLVHHLKPNMPWYEYPEYWRRHQHEIVENGSEVVVLTNRREAYALLPQYFLRRLSDWKERIHFYISQF